MATPKNPIAQAATPQPGGRSGLFWIAAAFVAAAVVMFAVFIFKKPNCGGKNQPACDKNPKGNQNGSSAGQAPPFTPSTNGQGGGIFDTTWDALIGKLRAVVETPCILTYCPEKCEVIRALNAMDDPRLLAFHYYYISKYQHNLKVEVPLWAYSGCSVTTWGETTDLEQLKARVSKLP